MPSGALFSSSTPPASSRRAPRSELVPQSTAIRCGTACSRSVPAGPLHHAPHEALAGIDLRLARMNSLGWCAWAMSPGPHTTVGTPSVLRKMPASVRVDDAAHRVGARPAAGQGLGVVVALGREGGRRGAQLGLDAGRRMLGLHLGQQLFLQPLLGALAQLLDRPRRQLAIAPQDLALARQDVAARCRR